MTKQPTAHNRQEVVLITGANGEIGHGLIEYLYDQPDVPPIIVLDLNPLAESLRSKVEASIVGNILDQNVLAQIERDYSIRTIFHLAALLSTTSEHNPTLAHEVNVQGTINLLEMAQRESQQRGEAVKFIFPSSIAVYGLPDLQTKTMQGSINEDQFLMPTTMYGANKLYCEHLGRYYATHYQQLKHDDERPLGVDFRCVRFPGIISAHTVPSGGTSDFAPEMIHAAAQGKPYPCFVRADTEIPFMVMPDAIRALIQLAEAPRNALSRKVYNVTSFSMTAAQVAATVQAHFTDCNIAYMPHTGRQAIVDTWPTAITDNRARVDWGWSPQYDEARAFDDYLFPYITERYATPETS